MKDHFKERSTRVYNQKQLFSKAELLQRESLCVHEQPAFCTAACPMKLDARQFVTLAASGDFSSARAMLERITPFPLILAKGCSHPCESACRLGEIGESIDIGALERAAMTHGVRQQGRGLLKFKKKKTAAVFGADLFTLAVAGEMCNKSYPTTFYVEERSAEQIISVCAPFLAAEDVAQEVLRLQKMDIQIVYESALSREFIEGLRPDYDIVCAQFRFVPEAFDAVTLMTEGSILTSDSAASGTLPALFDARRAAVSADRLVQGLDPAASRGDEGAISSRLYTNLSSVAPSKRIPEGDGYTADSARTEAGRCINCACEECSKGCVYLRHFKKFPRILTREIYNNTGIIMGDHMMNKAMNSCSLCGQCSFTCPYGYDMADICVKARENMVDTNKMSLAVHEFALLDMLFSNGEAFLSLPPVGQADCRYVFFPGCQACAIAPETVYKSYRDLSKRLDGGVALVLGCCGAIAKWAGRREMLAEQTEFLKNELSKLGNPTVIAGCPSCLSTLKENIACETVGLWDIISGLGLPEESIRLPRDVVIHDACAARGDHHTQDTVRSIAKSLGCDTIEAEWSGDKCSCCGYGGLVMYANREVAGEMARDRLKNTPDVPQITYCMACRDRLRREGADSRHLLELIYDAPAGEPPDISEKRKNRLLLKQRLLRDVLGVDVLKEELDFKLNITDEARALMDERMILESDVLAVMKAYHENKNAVFDEQQKLLFTSQRIGNVTFWVRFTIDGDRVYTIHRAYSHRMTISTRWEIKNG